MTETRPTPVRLKPTKPRRVRAHFQRGRGGRRAAARAAAAEHQAQDRPVHLQARRRAEGDPGTQGRGGSAARSVRNRPAPPQRAAGRGCGRHGLRRPPVTRRSRRRRRCCGRSTPHRRAGPAPRPAGSFLQPRQAPRLVAAAPPAPAIAAEPPRARWSRGRPRLRQRQPPAVRRGRAPPAAGGRQPPAPVSAASRRRGACGARLLRRQSTPASVAAAAAPCPSRRSGCCRLRQQPAKQRRWRPAAPQPTAPRCCGRSGAQAAAEAAVGSSSSSPAPAPRRVIMPQTGPRPVYKAPPPPPPAP